MNRFKGPVLTVVLGVGPVVLGLWLTVTASRRALELRKDLTTEVTTATARARTLDRIIDRLAVDPDGQPTLELLDKAIATAAFRDEKAAYQTAKACLAQHCEHPEASLEQWNLTLSEQLSPAWEAADDASQKARQYGWLGAVIALLGPLSIALLHAQPKGKPSPAPKQEDSADAQVELLRERLEQLYAARSQAGESARFAAFGELAAGLSHGLKTPIASILAAAQLGQLKAKDHPVQAQLEVIIREGEGLLEQVQRFLRAAAAVGPTRADTDLGQLLDALQKAYAEPAAQKGVRVELKKELDAVLQLDQALLEMALRNLVENALAIAPRGSAVRLTLAPGAPPARAGLEGEAPKAERWVTILVDDEGPGLPIAARVGQTGVTSKPLGSGLGLAIARRVVERHGGALSLEDLKSPDQKTGARVRVLLPLP